jgi:hypothetical protein
MKPTRKQRQRVDTMIGAHAWMRLTARTKGELPAPEGKPAATKPFHVTNTGADRQAIYRKSRIPREELRCLGRRRERRHLMPSIRQPALGRRRTERNRTPS